MRRLFVRNIAGPPWRRSPRRHVSRQLLVIRTIAAEALWLPMLNPGCDNGPKWCDGKLVKSAAEELLVPVYLANVEVEHHDIHGSHVVFVVVLLVVVVVLAVLGIRDTCIGRFLLRGFSLVDAASLPGPWAILIGYEIDATALGERVTVGRPCEPW
jgi:hypothetical protein